MDKPTRVHRTSATLIDNKLLARGNIISDISDHFSQFCVTTSAKDKVQQVKNIKILSEESFQESSPQIAI